MTFQSRRIGRPRLTALELATELSRRRLSYRQLSLKIAMRPKIIFSRGPGCAQLLSKSLRNSCGRWLSHRQLALDIAMRPKIIFNRRRARCAVHLPETGSVDRYPGAPRPDGGVIKGNWKMTAAPGPLCSPRRLHLPTFRGPGSL